MRLFNIIATAAAAALLCLSCSKESTSQGPDPHDENRIVFPEGENLNPSISPEGGTASVSFTAPGLWEATWEAGWIDVTPRSGSAGSARITISAGRNDNRGERAAVITISSNGNARNISVGQKGTERSEEPQERNEPTSGEAPGKESGWNWNDKDNY